MRNPKSEARNLKQIQMFEGQNPTRHDLLLTQLCDNKKEKLFWSFGFKISDLFRISIFEFENRPGGA